MDKNLLKSVLQEALATLEEIDSMSNQLSNQTILIQEIKNSLKNKEFIETCKVTITNNCGNFASNPQPMCVYTTCDNGEIKTKTIHWKELIESPTISVIKNSAFVIKDIDFQGINVIIDGEHITHYHDGSQFFVYSITNDCNIKISF